VFDMISEEDLQNLWVTFPQITETIDLYQHHHVLPRLIERAVSSRTHRIVAYDIAIIEMGRTKAQTEATIHDGVTKHLKANPFICVEMGCPSRRSNSVTSCIRCFCGSFLGKRCLLF